MLLIFLSIKSVKPSAPLANKPQFPPGRLIPAGQFFTLPLLSTIESFAATLPALAYPVVQPIFSSPDSNYFPATSVLKTQN